MSLEADVQELRSKQNTLDAAFTNMMKVIGGTHEVVTLILKEQLEMRKEQLEMRKEQIGMRKEMIEFRKETKENLKQIELLVRQTHSNH
ncbi:MAG: hypothetical protein ACR2PX_28860 [Endozoicomonas sp.]|uniref:hypothetical protein n=1 Tax=Endozoicomonas sp. TaxID=1892382 RepID=UPI003D9BD712